MRSQPARKGTESLAGCIPQLHMASTGVYIIILYIVYYCNIYYYILWYLSFNDIIKEKNEVTKWLLSELNSV